MEGCCRTCLAFSPGMARRMEGARVQVGQVVVAVTPKVRPILPPVVIRPHRIETSTMTYQADGATRQTDIWSRPLTVVLYPTCIFRTARLADSHMS